MAILALFEPFGVNAGRGCVVVVENLLDFAQRHTQLIKGMGCGVPGHMRFAGSQVPGANLFDGLDRKLCATAAVVGKRDPDRAWFLLKPVWAIQLLQILGQCPGCLHLQQRLTRFRAFRPREVDLEPVVDPAEIANMHVGQRPTALGRLQRHTEQRVITFARVSAAVDAGQQFAHVKHLDGLRAGVSVNGAPLNMVDGIVALVEALLPGILEQAGDGGQPVVIRRGRNLAFVLRGRGAVACPLLDNEEVAGESGVVGEIHQQVIAVRPQPGAQGDGRGVIGDMRLPALRLAGFGVQPGQKDAILWQVNHFRAVSDGAVIDLRLRCHRNLVARHL